MSEDRRRSKPSSSEPHSHQILSGIQSVWVRNMNIPDRQIRNGNGWSCDGNISATNRSWELRLAERNIRYLRYWTLHPIPPRSANNLVKHWSFYNQQPLPPRFANYLTKHWISPIPPGHRESSDGDDCQSQFLPHGVVLLSCGVG